MNETFYKMALLGTTSTTKKDPELKTFLDIRKAVIASISDSSNKNKPVRKMEIKYSHSVGQSKHYTKDDI